MKRITYPLTDIMSKDFNKTYYNCIYAIKNLLDGRFYIGQAKDLWARFYYSGFSHRFGMTYIDNSMRVHGYDKFEVIILLYNLDNDNRDENGYSELDHKEILYISKLHTFDHDKWWESHTKPKRQYNHSPGGQGIGNIKGMRSALEAKYPDSNGTPPQFWEAGHKACADIYGMGGVTPQMLKASHEARKKLYPESNGVSPNFWTKGKEALNRIYGMNGMTPQCIKAGIAKTRGSTNFVNKLTGRVCMLKPSDEDLIIMANSGEWACGTHWESSTWIWDHPKFSHLFSIQDKLNLALRFDESEVEIFKEMLNTLKGGD